MSCLLETLQQRAQSTPDAILFDDGQCTLAAGAAWHAIARLRAWMVDNDCKVIAIAGDNSIGWILSDLGLLDLPVRVIPLPGFFSSAQIAHVIARGHVDTVLGTPQALASISTNSFIDITQIDADFNIHAGRLACERTYIGHYEKVTFTSGSTGNPKGVRLDLKTLENTVKAIATALQPLAIETHLGVLPFTTLLENIAGVYAPLLQGVRIHLRRMEQLGLASPEQFNPFLLLNTFQNVQPHACILVPQLLLALVTLLERGLTVGNKSVENNFRFIAVGGGKVASSMIEKARAFQLPVFEGYGLSECGSVIALNLPGADRIGSVGKPLSHATINIAGDGEILVKGAVMSGYLLDEKTEECAVSRECNTDDVMSSGDIGYVDDDGFLYVSGRKKNMFITAFGRNVNPEWVEAELLHFLPIRQVTVWGEALAQNVALIVARSGFTQQDVDQAVAACNQQLPDYARVGRIVMAPHAFTVENGMATANGRIRRGEIEKSFSDILYQPNALPCIDNGEPHEFF